MQDLIHRSKISSSSIWMPRTVVSISIVVRSLIPIMEPITVPGFSLLHLHIDSYFLFDTENFAILEHFSVIGLGSEIVFDGLRVELHIHLVFIPDHIADAALPVIDLDRSPLGGLHLRYPDLIDFLLHIMAAKMVSCYLTLFIQHFGPKAKDACKC